MIFFSKLDIANPHKFVSSFFLSSKVVYSTSIVNKISLLLSSYRPRLGGSGNIITRRLCRNRRREDNELYRSNSFKFERFERKECLDELSNTLQKQVSNVQ